MSNHTPGPWKPYQIQNGITGNLLDKWQVAEADPACPADPHGITGKQEGLSKANAALIAAAPDLLAALRQALPFLEGKYERSDHMADLARAAIAKAEGTS